MPIRAYEPIQGPCRLCGAGFELMQSAAAAPLTTCPRCGQAVRLKPATAVATPRVSQAPSVSEARSAGFTVLKRTSGGEYEKL
ncbi:MAG: zinc ribbon domain-containing protein [Opitutaceae bacterium]|nr:zinc ribbon domain-containing protein [Opitutaceae bacterium]